MFFRITPKKYRDTVYRYLQLVETYRDGDRIRHRVLQSLGNVNDLSETERNRLKQALQQALHTDDPPHLSNLDTRHYADVLAIRTLWQQLGLPAIIKRLSIDRNTRFDVDLCCFLMVAQRLIRPASKSAISKWLRHVYLPGYDLTTLRLHHFYRALDFLHETSGRLQQALLPALQQRVQGDVHCIFADLATTFPHPSAARGERRKSRDPQMVLAVALGGAGMPLAHCTLCGNQPDNDTLQQTIARFQQQFNLQQFTFSTDGPPMHHTALPASITRHSQHLFILPRRGEAAHKLAARIEWAPNDTIADDLMAKPAQHPHDPDRTCLVCYHPARAQRETRARRLRLRSATDRLNDLRNRLRNAPPHDPARTLSAAKSVLTTTRTTQFFEIHSDPEGILDFQPRSNRIARASSLDGYCFLQSDRPDVRPHQLLPACETAFKAEHLFTQLAEFIKLRPLYHHTDRRRQGHVSVCLLAYLLQRILQITLDEAGCVRSAWSALDKLRHIRAVRQQLHNRVIWCVTQNRPEGSGQILDAIGLNPLPPVIEP